MEQVRYLDNGKKRVEVQMERDQRDKEGKLDTGTQLEYKEWKIT